MQCPCQSVSQSVSQWHSQEHTPTVSLANYIELLRIGTTSRWGVTSIVHGKCLSSSVRVHERWRYFIQLGDKLQKLSSVAWLNFSVLSAQNELGGVGGYRPPVIPVDLLPADLPLVKGLVLDG